jgi:hypothetical protein
MLTHASYYYLPQVVGVNMDGENSAVSSLAFCSLNMTLAVGTTSGLVRSDLYFTDQSNWLVIEC